MTVSALVITLAPGAPPLRVADPRLELGEPQGVHVPATLETEAVDPLGRPIRIACATCHTTREVAVMPASATDLRLFHRGLTFRHGELGCDSCHSVAPRRAPELHLANGKRVPMDEALQLCAQCHGPQFRDYGKGAHGGMNGAWDLTRGSRLRNHCVDCHDPHVPRIPAVTPAPRARDRARSEADHG